MVLTGTTKCITQVNMIFNQGIDKVNHDYAFQDVFAYEKHKKDTKKSILGCSSKIIVLSTSP
jgi:hypothetical protein